MLKTRAKQKLVSWIAFIAILMAALAPTISHAMKSHDGLSTALMEICTVEGMRMVDTGPADKSSDDKSKHSAHMEDCPYCRVVSALPGLPPTEWQWLPAPVGKAVLPRLFYQAPALHTSWLPPQSRAPPALS
ncbi:hypothetical protein D3C72_67740 [compost metagenome]